MTLFPFHKPSTYIVSLTWCKRKGYKFRTAKAGGLHAASLEMVVTMPKNALKKALIAFAGADPGVNESGKHSRFLQAACISVSAYRGRLFVMLNFNLAKDLVLSSFHLFTFIGKALQYNYILFEDCTAEKTYASVVRDF